MTINSELIDRIADHIEQHPEVHNQGSWYGDPRLALDAIQAQKPAAITVRESIDPDACNTTCCVAGWAAVLADDELFTQVIARSERWFPGDHDDRWIDLGRQLLGIDEDEARLLFYAMIPTEQMVELLRYLARNGELKRELLTAPEDYV